jgi:hypothetical protein
VLAFARHLQADVLAGIGRREEHQHQKTARLRKLRISDTYGSHLPRGTVRAGAGKG